MILPDGTVIPAGFGVKTPTTGTHSAFSDTTLRYGEVRKVIYPDDPKSFGKKTVEYEVQVSYREQTGTVVTANYRGATVSTMFGGQADRFHATLRPDTSNADGIGVGSKVLLLCLSGNQQQAIILGGTEDPTSQRVESSDTGHNLFFEFNGVRFTINDNGEPALFFRGATDARGHLRDNVNSANAGATITIKQDGTLSLFTTANGDDEHSINLNHTSRNLETSTSGDWRATVTQVFNVRASQGVRFNASLGGMDIGVRDDVNIQCSGIKVGGADQAWMRGTLYRQQQSILHNKMQMSLSTLSSLLSTVATSLTTAIPKLATPTIGGMLASGDLSAAVAALNVAAQMPSQIANAISSFEGQASGYISDRYFGD
jgi:phage gp45-like